MNGAEKLTGGSTTMLGQMLPGSILALAMAYVMIEMIGPATRFLQDMSDAQSTMVKYIEELDESQDRAATALEAIAANSAKDEKLDPQAGIDFEQALKKR